MLRDFLVIFGIAFDERSAIEICRGVPSIWGLSVHLKRKHLCKPYQHGGEAAGYDSPVGCQRYLTRTPVGHDLTSPLSVNTTLGGLKTFFQRF